MTNSIKLPQLAWFEPREQEFALPEGWRVEICEMAGHDRPKMLAEEIKDAVGRPIGMAPLREYARGKKEVVIICDDMSRVTRAAEIVPHVLAELAEAGIEDRQIRFIAACGCHAAMDRLDFEKKLGKDVLERFPVYNHSSFDNCVYAGTTRRGTKVLINAEVMKCDLKIGIGSIVPHLMAGFGGGSKMIVPGVAAYETIKSMHSPPKDTAGFDDTLTGMGNIEDNPRRQDMDEAAEIAGLDMKIDAIVNKWGDATALFAGKPREAFREELAAAREHYLSPAAKDKDIVIANSYAKVNEATTGLQVSFPAVKGSGGDVVLIANAPEGQITHYLMGPFGNSIGGQLQLRMKVPANVNRLIVYTEYPELSSLYYLEDTDKTMMSSDWNEVIRLLESSYGQEAEVAVYPNSDIQYCEA
jgi:nickel-dependent lactate racemase